MIIMLYGWYVINSKRIEVNMNESRKLYDIKSTTNLQSRFSIHIFSKHTHTHIHNQKYTQKLFIKRVRENAFG